MTRAEDFIECNVHFTALKNFWERRDHIDKLLFSKGAVIHSRKNQHRTDYLFDNNSCLRVQHTSRRVTAWDWSILQQRWLPIGTREIPR